MGAPNRPALPSRTWSKCCERPKAKRTLDAFVAVRRKEKLLAQDLTEYLCKTFVTPLEREDIEALSNALYKIPKTVEKFAERSSWPAP